MNQYLITYETVQGETRSTTICDVAAENARNTLKAHIVGVTKILSTVKIKNPKKVRKAGNI
jgi:hypothetical protein